jgi:hypothetical protein
MRLLDFQIVPIHNGRRRGVAGYATVELPGGMIINNCEVTLSKAGLAGRMPHGLRWCNKYLTHAFSDRLVALVLERHPELHQAEKRRAVA